MDFHIYSINSFPMLQFNLNLYFTLFNLFVCYVLFLDPFGEIDGHERQFLDVSYHFETRNFLHKNNII
jgi:hypothetical protein